MTEQISNLVSSEEASATSKVSDPPSLKMRTDPYLAWAAATDYAGMPLSSYAWIPMLIELDGSVVSKKPPHEIFRSFINDRKLLLPPYLLRAAHPGRFSVYVYKETINDFVAELSKSGIRWELGLPFGSPINFTPFNLIEWNKTKSATPNSKTKTNKHIVGFIDYGCAFANQKFRVWSLEGKPTLKSRVLALWDQGGDPFKNREAAKTSTRGIKPPQWLPVSWDGNVGYAYGAEITRYKSTTVPWLLKAGLTLDEYISQFIQGVQGASIDEEACYHYAGYKPILAPITHGTHMMDIAAGYPNPLLRPGDIQGEAPDDDIVFVQLPRYFSDEQVSGLLRTYVLDAVHYILSFAENKDTPVTINLSYGAYTGPHDGTSILEQALDDIIASERANGRPFDIVIAAGNGGDVQAHAGKVVQADDSYTLNWCNIPDNPTDQFTEVWLTREDPAEVDTANLCAVRFTPPGFQPQESQWVRPGQQLEIVHNGERIAMVIAPKSVCQSTRGRMVLLAVAPTALKQRLPGRPYREPAPYGDWLLEIYNPSKQTVQVDAWIERDDPVFMSGSGPRQARFNKSDSVSARTLNSIAHGSNTVVVGGYVGGSLRTPDYSAFGPGRGDAAFRDAGRAASAAGKSGPEWLAICEESDSLPGIAAAAVIGTERVRLPGTSVSAAAATRYVVTSKNTSGNATPVVSPNSTIAVPGNSKLPGVPSPFIVPIISS